MRAKEWRLPKEAEAARERRAASCRLAEAVRGEHEMGRRLAAEARPTIEWALIGGTIDARRDAEAALGEWRG